MEYSSRHEQFRSRRAWYRRGRVWLGVTVIAVLVVVGVAVPAGLSAWHIARSAQVIEQTAQGALMHTLTRDWQELQSDLVTIETEITRIDQQLQRVGPAVVLPPVGQTVQGAQLLLPVLRDTINVYGGVAALFADLEHDISSSEPQALLLTAQGRRSMLAALDHEHARVAQIQARLSQIRADFAAISVSDLRGPMRSQLLSLHRYLGAALEHTTVASALAEVIPEVLGHEREKTYLFVFQNNTELRPTGGFIGSYGLVKISEGELTGVMTDDIYNLDKLSEGELAVPAPAPLQRYNNQKLWYLRDANWSPDWPTAARQVLWFWEQETRNAGVVSPQLDGVIALTPDFIAELLTVTGPITIDGVTFQKEGFTQTLEQFVEFDYADQGIHKSQRKAIMLPLTLELIKRIEQLPPDKLVTAWQAFKRNIDEKNILVYLTDEQLQDYFDQHNWSGSVRHNDGDYLMLVDSNLAALKTDQAITRSLSYQVSESDAGELYGELRVQYQHGAEPLRHLITRYRTYARVYAPAGSWFESAHIERSGQRQELAIGSDVELSDELGKRVAAAFVTVEPQTDATLVLRYRLPESVRDQYRAGRYTLLVQKQPGTGAPALQVHIGGRQGIDAYQGSGQIDVMTGKSVRWQTELAVDREFRVLY